MDSLSHLDQKAEIDAEILAAAIAFVKAKEQGVNSQAFYRRLRRAWIAKVRG